MKPCGVPSRAVARVEDRLEQPAGSCRSRSARAVSSSAAQVRIVGALPGPRGAAPGLARYSARSATRPARPWSAVVREAGDADADRSTCGPPVVVGQLGDAAADPLGDLVGAPVGARQDDGELVAAVAVGAIAGAGGRPHRARRPDEERVAGRVAAGVVERLEARRGPSSGPRTARPPTPARRLAELALEGAVVAQAGERVALGPDLDRAVGLGVLEGDRGLAGEQLGQLELVRR